MQASIVLCASILHHGQEKRTEGERGDGKKKKEVGKERDKRQEEKMERKGNGQWRQWD